MVIGFSDADLLIMNTILTMNTIIIEPFFLPSGMYMYSDLGPIILVDLNTKILCPDYKSDNVLVVGR